MREHGTLAPKKYAERESRIKTLRTDLSLQKRRIGQLKRKLAKEDWYRKDIELSKAENEMRHTEQNITQTKTQIEQLQRELKKLIESDNMQQESHPFNPHEFMVKNYEAKLNEIKQALKEAKKNKNEDEQRRCHNEIREVEFFEKLARQSASSAQLKALRHLSGHKSSDDSHGRMPPPHVPAWL